MPHFTRVANPITERFRAQRVMKQPAPLSLQYWLMLGGLVSLFLLPLPVTAAQERACAHDSEQRFVPNGPFIMGSSPEERETAYRLDDQVTRAYGWYEKEARSTITTSAFCIDRYPVTNSEYHDFMRATRRAGPYISPEAYRRRVSSCTPTRP